MPDIIYEEGNEELLDLMKPLWEKHNEQHSRLSIYFSDSFLNKSFEKRKSELLELAETALIRVDLVKDFKEDKYIGFCVSTVDQQKTGKVESLFIEEAYRGLGIGNVLMNKVLAWMDHLSVVKKQITVAYGNEKVLSFYKKFGFYPNLYVLEQINQV